MPEPSGRSFAELDLLFQKGVSARKFATTQVDVFEEDIDGDFMSRYHKQTRAKEADRFSGPQGLTKLA